jgi:hypothetical protein
LHLVVPKYGYLASLACFYWIWHIFILAFFVQLYPCFLACVYYYYYYYYLFIFFYYTISCTAVQLILKREQVNWPNPTYSLFCQKFPNSTACINYYCRLHGNI